MVGRSEASQDVESDVSLDRGLRGGTTFNLLKGFRSLLNYDAIQ